MTVWASPHDGCGGVDLNLAPPVKCPNTSYRTHMASFGSISVQMWAIDKRAQILKLLHSYEFNDIWISQYNPLLSVLLIMLAVNVYYNQEMLGYVKRL